MGGGGGGGWLAVAVAVAVVTRLPSVANRGLHSARRAATAPPLGRRFDSGPLSLAVVAAKMKHELFGEVQVRSAVLPQGEWSPEQALGLLKQGYGVDRVAALTRYDRRWVAAQHRRVLQS